MTIERDVTRIVRSWLQVDEHESADRVLDNVLALLDATPQRRSMWPARRIADMNSFAKLLIAAAAVVVIAIVGINLLPKTGGDVGVQPVVSPSPSASPTPVSSPLAGYQPSLLPEPTPQAGAFPAAGAVKVGTQAFSQSGVRFTMDIATTGWTSRGIEVAPDGGNLTKSAGTGTAGAWMLSWSIDGVYADPCGHLAAPPAGTSVADLADAVASMPGVEVVTAPTDVTVGGHAAKTVAIRIPADIGCGPSNFFLWYDNVRCGSDSPCHRWVSEVEETNRVWIIDVDGTRVWIEAETYKGATPEIVAEVQGMIDSIKFE
jgi:hypothetical protein